MKENEKTSHSGRGQEKETTRKSSTTHSTGEKKSGMSQRDKK